MADAYPWPNCDTWLIGSWLDSNKPTYQSSAAIACWDRFQGDPRRSELARAAMAEKIYADMTNFAAYLTPFNNVTRETTRLTPEMLASVDWSAVADNALCRIQDYEPLA